MFRTNDTYQIGPFMKQSQRGFMNGPGYNIVFIQSSSKAPSRSALAA
jgi:hypothetical protein